MADFLGRVVVYANEERVPVLFDVESNGFATVLAARLSLRFKIKEDSVHVDQEVYDCESGSLSHTVSQVPSIGGMNRSWNLNPSKYRAYGVQESDPCISPRNGAPYRSSLSSFQTPLFSQVKLEPNTQPVFILSDDSDVDSPQKSPPTLVANSSKSPAIESVSTGFVIDSLRCLRALKGCRNIFSKLDYDTIDIRSVSVLPPSFNGNVIFELPSLDNSSSTSQTKQMAGMDKRCDGHAWSKTSTTNIINRMGLAFRKFVCLGHLRCANPNCEFLSRVHRTKEVNELEWEGLSLMPIDVGQSHPPGSTLVCKVCKEHPSCIAWCNVRVYYVFGNSNLTRAFVHLGHHEHLVKDGELKDMKEMTRALIEEQMERTPSATNSSIVMEATKELLGGLLLRPDGVQPKTLNLEELVPVLDKCKYLSSPSIRNEVSSFKHFGRFGVIDSITKLRGSSAWAFVQESKFLGQGTDVDKVFVFKMSELGPGSGVNLVKRMQAGGDLEAAWIMFDHVKRVKGWTTMACHVYDSSYCRVMTIACCDMQSEDCTAQVLFWRNLNSVLARNGIPDIQFKGFMADSAQANWNAVRLVYGSGVIAIPMENRERISLFHWTQSMEKHTKAEIRGDLQDQHRLLCKQYKNATSPEQSETRYLAIKSWWLSSGATTVEGVSRLELWLSFWHFRYRQWGGFMQLNLTELELAEMPSCNLAETVHNKWLQQSGNRGNDLYIATIDDFVREFMQMVKYYQYLKDNQSGMGPGKEELLLRVAQRSAKKTSNPKPIAEAISNIRGVQEFIYVEPHLQGEEVFGSQKRKADMPLGCEFDSHRPDKVNFSHPIVQTRSTQANTSAPNLNTILENDFPMHHLDIETGTSDAATVDLQHHLTSTHVSSIQETMCDELQWHIARLPRTSAKACFALQAVTKKKCTAQIFQNNTPTAASTYTGMMVNYRKNRNDRMQFFFCNDDIERCVKGTRRKWVLSVPPIPTIWPVKIGTKLSKAEVLSLEAGGFVLPQRQVVSPRRLFGADPGVALVHAYPTPLSPDEYPTLRAGKVVRRNAKAPTVKHENNCASALTLNGRIEKVTMVPHPGFRCIVSLKSGMDPKVELYLLTISSFPDCTCPNF